VSAQPFLVSTLDSAPDELLAKLGVCVARTRGGRNRSSYKLISGDAVLKDVRVSRIRWKARVDHANQNAYIYT
jgi:hypothetical protein